VQHDIDLLVLDIVVLQHHINELCINIVVRVISPDGAGSMWQTLDGLGSL
jgi:hypothetical protein